MGRLEWSEELSVGIGRLDGQHRRWLQIVNDLERSVEVGGEASVARGALARMLDYTRVHFEAEEELMRRTAYPEYESHKALHEEFVRECEGLASTLEEGGVNAARVLVAVARRWFVRHILVVDRAYTEHFAQSGLS